MKATSPQVDSSPRFLTRRHFLGKTSIGLAGAAVLATPRAGYTAEDNTIKVALVGCGGRGTGAGANALATQSGPTKLWALADLFPERLEGSLQQLEQRFPKQVEVSSARRFLGFQAFKDAIDAVGKGGAVLLATPAAFRPSHVAYAVEKGVHVFMEKSFAVDAPGVRRLLKIGELAAQKNVKVAGGLMWRHSKPRQEVIRRIHDGQIGDLVTLRTYRMHGPVGFRPPQPGESLLANQIANYSSFNWLNASFFVDWLIHNIDVCCWAKNAWPTAAQGMGGRQTRTEPDEMWDHYFVEYSFADGTRMLAQARHMSRCYDIFSDIAHGTKGSAVIMENLAKPNSRLYRNHVQTPPNEIWRYKGPEPDEYQLEHDYLFEAIRRDQPYNETERCAKACMASILGRMACYSGQMVTWEEAMASDLQLAPDLEKWTSLKDAPPVRPDASGKYTTPMPGITKAF